MGRKITIDEPETDPDGFFPKGPASICLEAPPERQCYTAPKDYGRFPSVEFVQLHNDVRALLFSAATGGVSGWTIQYSLLVPGKQNELDDLFAGGISVSNQSQHTFWREPALSPDPIFVTAEFVWGTDDGHYGPHRFIISAYLRRPSWLLDGSYYSLSDRFMTVGTYDLEENQDVLASEKLEAIARLKKVVAALPQPPGN